MFWDKGEHFKRQNVGSKHFKESDYLKNHCHEHLHHGLYPLCLSGQIERLLSGDDLTSRASYSLRVSVTPAPDLQRIANPDYFTSSEHSCCLFIPCTHVV